MAPGNGALKWKEEYAHRGEGESEREIKVSVQSLVYVFLWGHARTDTEKIDKQSGVAIS